MALRKVRMNVESEPAPAPLCCFRGDFYYVHDTGGNCQSEPPPCVRVVTIARFVASAPHPMWLSLCPAWNDVPDRLKRVCNENQFKQLLCRGAGALL